MREERLEVSVTFDERHGYVASAPDCGRRSSRSRSAACAARSRSLYCPTTSASSCSSTAAPSANATAAGRRRSWRTEPGVRDVYSYNCDW